MPGESQIVASESPVPVVVQPWGLTPLTPCCKARAKGGEDCIYCKGCYEAVEAIYGYCWKSDDEAGWSIYKDMLWIAGVPADKVDEIAAHVREKVAAVTL